MEIGLGPGLWGGRCFGYEMGLGRSQAAWSLEEVSEQRNAMALV